MPEIYANRSGGDHQPIGEVFSMPDQARKNFAKRLRALRERRYPTAKDFAHELGIQPQRYGKWELGHAEPSIAMLLRVCQLLGTTPDYLLLGLDRIMQESTSLKSPDPVTLKSRKKRAS